MRWLVGISIALYIGLYPGSQALGQEQNQWHLMIGAGLEGMSSRDELGSPMLYRGVGFPLQFGVKYERSLWAVRFEGGGFYSGFNGRRLESARADADSHWADGVAVDLLLQVDRVLVDEGGHILRVGGRINHWTLYRSYQYAPHQIGAVESWDGPVTLELVAGLHRPLFSGVEVGLWAAVPVGGWVVRPHYSVRGDERMDFVDNRLRVVTEGSWATWTRLQMLMAQAELRWDLSPRVALIGRYTVGLFSFRQDTTTRALRRRGSLGVSLSF